MSINIIHIGVGGRGRHWLDFVAQHPEFAAVACVDIDEKALESARRAPGQDPRPIWRRCGRMHWRGLRPTQC